MIKNKLLMDLVHELPPMVRQQRLVEALKTHFHCGAVALLQLEDTHLRPVAVDGLVRECLGRRFAVRQHPRLSAILMQSGVTNFDHDSTLPDPYDGLIDGCLGQTLSVHDCMGTRLYSNGHLWGVLTFDALDIGTFNADSRTQLQQLTPLIEAVIHTTHQETEIRTLRLTRGSEHLTASTHKSGEIAGQSPAITQLLHELSVVADSELPVLLLGETGVGKELFAHRLHRMSRRKANALIHVNCAALPESLAESELFGHVKGAFSGANSDRPGRFEAAEGGTLFLDEVGELPLAVQAKLLRTLQNGEIQRLGADQPRLVNVRVIAATNRSLRDQVRDGAFRADLYHRLSIYPIHIPPLRERGNDVLILAGRFLELNRARLGLRSLRLSPEAELALRQYNWPGNVRELEHAISRAALKMLSRGADRNDIVTLPAELLDLDDLHKTAPHIPPDLANPAAAPTPANATGGTKTPAEYAPVGLKQATESSQYQAIQNALSSSQGNWAQAARQLRIDPSNLHKLARRLGVK